jgi:hypothetical protein
MIASSSQPQNERALILRLCVFSPFVLQCYMYQVENGDLICGNPPWVVSTASSTQVSDPLFPGSYIPGLHCPLFGVSGNPYASVAVDEDFYDHTLCTCDAGFWGCNGRCIKCPDQCSCNGTVVKDCFPIMTLGTVKRVSLAEGNLAIDQPFTVTEMLPCQRSIAGDTLCNPHSKPWPQFLKHLNNPDATNDDLQELLGFCDGGHQGRLCTQCRSGYFESGRFCMQCMGTPMHVVILLLNLLFLAAIVAYVYKQQPTDQVARQTLLTYLHEERNTLLAVGINRQRKQKAKAALPPMLDVPLEERFRPADPSSSSSSDAADVPVAIVASSPPPSRSRSAAADNPLKLLIFHSQQLSLLFLSSVSLPTMLSGFVRVSSNASTGFSPSLLLAMDCLGSWTLEHKCLMALLTPLLICAVAAANRWWYLRRVRKFNPFDALGIAAPARSTESDDHAQTLSNKINGTCMAMMYMLLMPCVQVSLTALGCTDTRESAHTYLNLQPFVRCDEHWRTRIFPPAFLAMLWWCVVFPLGTTLLMRRMHHRLVDVANLRSSSTSSHQFTESASSSSSFSSSSSSLESSIDGTALRSWSLYSGLMSPFSARYWYFEQILLLRRLALAAVVCIIPQQSLYLPLLLLAVIQCSALAQHAAAPYRSAWLNRGETISLFLLNLNYLTALVEQSAVAQAAGGSNGANDRVWVMVRTRLLGTQSDDEAEGGGR